MYSTDALDPLLPAVDDQELADFLAVDLPDTVLAMVSLMATSMAVEFLRSELLSRDRLLTYQSWPYSGGSVAHVLSPSYPFPSNYVTLPYARLVSVASVTAYGELVDPADYLIRDTKPASIGINVYGSGESPALVVAYRAGYGDTLADVPKNIQYGIMLLAAYLYEHRGACDANQALKQSGAYSYLYPFRLQPVAM